MTSGGSVNRVLVDTFGAISVNSANKHRHEKESPEKRIQSFIVVAKRIKIEGLSIHHRPSIGHEIL